MHLATHILFIRKKQVSYGDFFVLNFKTPVFQKKTTTPGKKTPKVWKHSTHPSPPQKQTIRLLLRRLRWPRAGLPTWPWKKGDIYKVGPY